MVTLQEIRKEQGLSRMAFAKNVGITHRALVSYESGSRRPQPEVAERIASYFDLSIEQIWEMFYATKEGEHAVPKA